MEVDETFIGGKRKNMPAAKRRALRGTGPGGGKEIVAGVKDRHTNIVVAQPIEVADKPTLHGMVGSAAVPGATIYTDEVRAYQGLPFPHEAVNHSAGEYVRDQAHTNGIESSWVMLKRGYHGTYHHMSAKHLSR